MQDRLVAVFLLGAVLAYGGPALDRAETTSEAEHAKWSAFKAKHGKVYAAHEEDARKATFLEHSRFIDEHNERFRQGLETFELSHNKLSDLTMEEIAATRLGVLASQPDIVLVNASWHVTPDNFEVPASLDWRTQGAVSPVKDQDQCLGCYAFAVVSMIIPKKNVLLLIFHNLGKRTESLRSVDRIPVYDSRAELGNMLV